MASDSNASSESLSSSEAEILVSQIAHTSGAGVPLATGLQAAALEVGSHRLSRVLNRLAASIARGASLSQAIQEHGRRLPPHVVSLLTAAEGTGRIGSVFAEWVACRQASQAQWRNLRAALAYPAITLLLTGGLSVFLSLALIPQIQDLVKDFGLKLPTSTWVLFWWGNTGVWLAMACAATLLLLAIAIRLFGGRASWSRVVMFTPLVGQLWHWSGVAEMLRLLAMLFEERIPLDNALQVLGPGLSDAYVGTICRRLASQVQRGEPLSKAIESAGELPNSIIPFVRWGEQTGLLPEALRATAEMLEARLARGVQVLATILPPLVFLTAATMVLSLFIALLMPLYALIRGLT